VKNPFDAVISFFAPKAGLARARARHAMRIYDGASAGRRATAWRARHTSANAELSQALRALRDRSRDLVRNTPHAPRMLDVMVTNIVGTGLTPVCKTGDKDTDKKVMALWNQWQKNADLEGRLTFNGIQALAVRSMIESGDVALRLMDQRVNRKRGLVPFKVQLLESDFIDQFREGIYSLAEGAPENTKRSRMGVGLGEYGEPTGLWLLPWHPGEITTYNLRPGISEFVPKDEVLHLFRMLRPGQVRGVPWFAPVLTTARELSDFLDAVNMKARVEACFAGFITNSDELDPLVDSTPDEVTHEQVTMLEPGMLKELKAGQDIKFAQPTSNMQVEPMFLFNLMAYSAGIGCTYDQATGDMRQANYSSLRAGKIDFRRTIEHIQHVDLIPKLCDPVWDRFIDRAILAGMLKDRDEGYPVNWVTPSWEPINPRLDLLAEIQSVRAGHTSPQAFIASWGHDWRDVIDQWAEFNAYCDEKGVVLDLDARLMTQAGIRQQAADTGAAPKQTAKSNGKANGNGTADPGDEVVDADGNPIDPDEQQAMH
jgi:lambda family phage portal protein